MTRDLRQAHVFPHERPRRSKSIDSGITVLGRGHAAHDGLTSARWVGGVSDSAIVADKASVLKRAPARRTTSLYLFNSALT